MSAIGDSELILSSDGSIYHLGLKPDEIATTIIGVGDPDRVKQVSRHFDTIEVEKSKREFVTHTGYIGPRRLTVISTGIGTDNTEIVFTELDALLNIDFDSRLPKMKRKQAQIIRIGTSGSLQEDITVGSEVATNYAVGLDNLMAFYTFGSSSMEQGIASEIKSKARLSFLPYCAQGSTKLMQSLASDMTLGNTVTAPGFYAPQGRSLVLSLKYPDLMDCLATFDHNGIRLTNFEMETSTYYALSRLMGHEVISLNAILANRVTKKFASDPHQLVENLIVKTLDQMSGR
ncbi:MAG: nucleoside phosphorylase [Cyclobacteriaceae bacterium]